MMRVLGCTANEHNIWLVIVAALLCCAGTWVVAQLFHRVTISTGRQRVGWYIMTAFSAGVATWCTHFVAMLGYDARAPWISTCR